MFTSGEKFVLASHLNADQIEYMCGMGAAVASVLVTFPFNKITFRQSMWGVDVFDAMRQLYREGFFSLFRGCLPPVLIKSINSSVMFGSYYQYGQWLTTSPSTAASFQGQEMKTVFVAAMMSGTTEALLTPFERVQSILQDGRFNNQYRNTFDAFRQLKRYGILEYYRGTTAILLRNGPTTFVYFAYKDKLKDFLLPKEGFLLSHWNASRSHKETLRSFVSGATLGSAISTFVYPLNVIRIQMMVQEVGSRHLSVLGTAYNLYTERHGNANLMFSGIQTNLARSFFYWGCMTVFSEMLRDYFTGNN
ncbi:hypothetical protein TYRP_012423 [Tyrophagus putrescentiae]|nr:hypothetical protein TYRP_012423 [Tyrophagus putrescentiae]